VLKGYSELNLACVFHSAISCGDLARWASRDINEGPWLMSL
jgi:hypothetical protein